MVSTGNKSKLMKSEYCQTCAKCCKEFNCSFNLDAALRFMWMEERKIKTKDSPFQLPYNGGNEKHVKFKFPCAQLAFVDTKYKCKVWDSERPDFCNTYPDHIFYDCEVWNREKIQKLLDFEVTNCPGLKDVTVDDVINMLNEVRK